MSRRDRSSGRDNRLYWRSRRGMLELELQLIPFFERRYRSLPRALQQAYAEMLEMEDWQIYDWLQANTPPPDGPIGELVALIRAGS